MSIDVNEKIQGILQSDSLEELSLKYLPPVSDSPDNYYFISYSHKDYKAVYQDIFALQAQGVNLWYDRAMPVGENWKETAEKYIRPSRCAGVVFYVSENSLLSPAIHEEIAFAKKCGKSCITINLPFADGKSYSAQEMLAKMIADGVEIQKKKYKFISETFNKDVLYLPYATSSEKKAEKICALKKPPLLKISHKYSIQASVIAVNDMDVTTVQNSDFDALDSSGNKMNVKIINDCAFANCSLLQKIELPVKIHTIGDYAFYNCTSLKSVHLPCVEILGTSAFEYCSSLEEVEFGYNHTLFSISDRAFFACDSLKKISIPEDVGDIGEGAFASSGLTEIFISKNITHIADSAFENCCDLSKIVVDKNNSKYASFCDCLIDKSRKILMYGTSNSVLPNDGSIEIIAGKAFARGNGFSMSNYYKYCGANHIFHHAEYGDVDICNMYLSDNCIVIPQGVREIESFAFNECGLQEIVLPDSITTIYPCAFCNCNHLESICFIGTKKQWNGIEKDDYIGSYDVSTSQHITIRCLDGEIL